MEESSNLFSLWIGLRLNYEIYKKEKKGEILKIAELDWEPELIVDSVAKASTTFYNADITGEMEVVVEAISEDGKIGYQELTYNVVKRDLKK